MKFPIQFVTVNRALRVTLGAVCLAIFAGLSTADTSYRLNPGDKVKVDVWGEENLHADVIVLPDGIINFPLIGATQAAGKTTAELAGAIKEKLTEFIPAPEVNVALITLEGNTIYVIGEVVRPGAYVMSKNLTIVQALSMAGGFTAFAERNGVHVVRRENDQHTISIPFRYTDVEDGEALDSIVVLQSGDTIIVP